MAPAPFIVEVNTAPALRRAFGVIEALPGRRAQCRGRRARSRRSAAGASLVWLVQPGALLELNNGHQRGRFGHPLVQAAKTSLPRSVPPPSPAFSHAALPNPSLKPSPNSKTPGPRYSSGVHFLQRGPGVFLSVPA